MAFSADTIKVPLHEQIASLQQKIQLLEGDRAAYYESSQATMKNNRESIRQLRQETKKLYRDLYEANAGEEGVIRTAFHDRGLEKDVYRNMTGKAALTTLDQRVLSRAKRLNALKHVTHTHQRQLRELKVEYQKINPGRSSRAATADACARRQEEDAMRLRALENSLEKTQFKCKEAEKIMVNYLGLKRQLQEESLTFQGQMNILEAEILKCREELHQVQAMSNNAQLSKDALKAELQQQEELMYKERKERERIIASYRKKVEERKAHGDKTDKRGQKSTTQQDELSFEAQQSATRMAGGEEKAISAFEEAFSRIKEATAVTTIEEIAERFISQKETHKHLEKLKVTNEELLLQLKEQKELLKQQFEEMKYSGEAQLSSDQQMLEEREQQLQAQQQTCDAAKKRMNWLSEIISTVRAGVEHLADKLKHIPLKEGVVPEVPDFDHSLVKLMTQCEMKLPTLYDELLGKDRAAIMKEMEEEEFFVKIEGKLPEYNTRVKIPDDPTLDFSNDEAESEEDESDIISREALKRQSQVIIDSRSKKKLWNKKF